MTRSLRLYLLRCSLAAVVFAVCLSAPAQAQGGCLSGGTGGCPPDSGTPEIDPSLATGGLTLLGGLTLVVRARRKF